MNNQPREILKHILGYIPGHILIFLTRVSKEWLDLIENHILRLDFVPSLEECVMTQNYFYGRNYSYNSLYEHQKYLIKLVNNKIFIQHFQITNLKITINKTIIEYSREGHLNVVKLLLEKGANIHVNNDEALRWSANNGHIEVVKLLLEKGADIHAEDDSALRWSAENGHIEVVKLLLEKGADLHADNDYALRRSATNGHIEVVKLLLENGADIHVNNDSILLLSKNVKMIQFLITYVSHSKIHFNDATIKEINKYVKIGKIFDEFLNR